MSQQYDNKGQVALWANEKYEAGGTHPRLKGNLVAHRDIAAGETIDVALWDGSSDNPKAPSLKGKFRISLSRSSQHPLAQRPLTASHFKEKCDERYSLQMR